MPKGKLMTRYVGNNAQLLTWTNDGETEITTPDLQSICVIVREDMDNFFDDLNAVIEKYRI